MFPFLSCICVQDTFLAKGETEGLEYPSTLWLTSQDKGFLDKMRKKIRKLILKNNKIPRDKGQSKPMPRG